MTNKTKRKLERITSVTFIASFLGWAACILGYAVAGYEHPPLTIHLLVLLATISVLIDIKLSYEIETTGECR